MYSVSVTVTEGGRFYIAGPGTELKWTLSAGD